jgi:hypothetical protein
MIIALVGIAARLLAIVISATTVPGLFLSLTSKNGARAERDCEKFPNQREKGRSANRAFLQT